MNNKKIHLFENKIPNTYIFRYRLYNIVAFARALNLATPINLLTHYAKGTPSFML